MIVAIRFFRSLIGLQEEFYVKHLTEKDVLGPVLEVLINAMPRDNLLSSASLELFEYIKKEGLKDLVKHLVNNHRDHLVSLSYMATFRDLILRYDQTQGYTANMDYFLETEEDVGRKPPPTTRLMDQIAVDPREEEYWDAEDPEEDVQDRNGAHRAKKNGSSTPSKPLVDYTSDEDGDEPAEVDGESKSNEEEEDDSVKNPNAATPPERLSEKRRREEDDDDELGKLMQNKRRNSSSSESNSTTSSSLSQRRKSFTAGAGNGTPKKIAISLSTAFRTGGPKTDAE